MKLSQFIILILVIIAAWASLFTTALILNSRQLQQLSNDHTLLNKDTDIINGQTNTIKILGSKIDSLQNHDDCLFTLATRPNHSSDYIADSNQCAIASATPSSLGKVSAPSLSPDSSSSPPQSAPTPNKTQANSPPSLVCDLTLRLLGCAN